MQRLHFLTQFLEHPTFLNVATLLALCVVAMAVCYLLSRRACRPCGRGVLLADVLGELVPGRHTVAAGPSGTGRGPDRSGAERRPLDDDRRLVLRPLHLALLCAAAWAVASGIIVGTIFGHLGFYSLLDRFGIVPFALFTLAPLIFGWVRQRNILLIGLVVIGLNLGGTGVLEGLTLTGSYSRAISQTRTSGSSGAGPGGQSWRAQGTVFAFCVAWWLRPSC